MTTKTLIEKAQRALDVLQAMEQHDGALWQVLETPEELDALCSELRAAITAAGQDDTPHPPIVRALNPADVLVERWSSRLTSGFVVRPPNGIRLTHVPTRMVVKCDTERGPHANRDKAWRELEHRLATWSDCEIRASAEELSENRAPVSAPPSLEAAHRMGAEGGPVLEEERLAFEAWMAGHCWQVSGTWDGKTYVSRTETGSFVDPGTMATRQLWAAWRDRAALAKI